MCSDPGAGTARIVYVVEADPGVRASLHWLLALRPDQVVFSFARGDLFLARAGTLAPGMLLLDLDTDEPGGIALLASLDRLYRGKFVPVVLTDGASRELVIRAMQTGAVDVVEKPYRPDDLLGTLDSAFACLEEQSATAPGPAMARAKIGSLSGREREVMARLVEGHGNRAIARAFGISVRSIELYRSKMMAKLGVRNITAVVRIAFAAGLIS